MDGFVILQELRQAARSSQQRRLSTLRVSKRRRAAGRAAMTAARKVVGRKRHMAVDVEGSLIAIEVHAASVQDRNGAPAVIALLLEVAASVKKLFADSGYAGPKLQEALKGLGVSELIEIVPKPKGAKGFTVLYRRWVVERTLASSLAWVKLAGCRFLMGRVARRQDSQYGSEIATW